ncbi:triple tyrosine motif-containing protein [uncultured Bacteroides sp.]|uniref:triple tyrosine motif-containing protein n=1 Tax=uncultured Bacteroides sp. TaxID=162156 RepID=UPI002AAB56A4|nr:triple tyrosine motif-containing protein [uncultured Bacteroides sp.]
MKSKTQKLSKLLLFLILSFFPITRLSASWNNFIIHYKKEVYGKGSQTWQVASYYNNWVFFANKNGMLQFDGSDWGVFPMNNGADVRSVFPSRTRKRIYVGGINEYGYFEPDERGKLVYHCMSDSVRASLRSIGNIWQIHENDNILYWQADGVVLKYLNGKYTLIVANSKIDCSSLVNGILYIGTSKGVQILIGNSFFPLPGAEELISKRIRGIIPHKKGVIIATAYDGLYYWDGKKLTRFITGVETFMSQNEIFSIASSKDQIALGTVHMGLILIDKNTMQVKYFNENNGLQNNTVLSLGFDSRENLWAGLDNGIDYICMSSPLTNLYSYPYSYGAGYSAILSGNYLYLGTNRGLYFTNYPVSLNDKQLDIRHVDQSSGQVWDLCRVGNDIFCLHDRGIFLVKGETMKRIGTISGVWNCKVMDNHPDKVLLGMYDGIYVMQKEQGVWKLKKRLEGMNDSAENFEFESDNIIWLHNNDRGLIRFEIDLSTFCLKSIKYYGKNKGLPSNRNVYVNKVKGNIYFTTPFGVYKYNKAKDVLEVCADMNNSLNGAKSYLKLYQYGNHVLGLSNSGVNIANLDTYKKGGEGSFYSIEHPSIELVKGYEKLIPLSETEVIIPNDYGFALLKLDSKQMPSEKPAVHIRSVYLSYPNDSLIYSDNFLRRIYVPEIPYHRNSIRFEYDLYSFTHGEEASFRYRFKDQKEWSDYTSSLTKEYSNLEEGEYTFQVEAVFADGRTSVNEFTFIILPPWYRSTIAYLFYFILILCFLWYVYRWDKIRMKRKKQQAVFEKDKELFNKEKEFAKENARKEHQIMELEKEKLEYDLQHKSQEMANLMINFVRKNEMLTEIKQELFKVMSTLKGEGTKQSKQMLMVVNSKIDSNIQSDEVLKRIEEQFDLIHNNFMKRLSEKHPDLSANERMMCAYIKMNLSSKEIAPLLNISLRGVETIRYRLRKKFNLDRDESLTDYLANKL